MAKVKKVKARVLLDTLIEGVVYPCDSLIEGDEAAIAALAENGSVDAEDAAVAYVKECGKTLIALKVERLDSIPQVVDENAVSETSNKQTETNVSPVQTETPAPTETTTETA